MKPSKGLLTASIIFIIAGAGVGTVCIINMEKSFIGAAVFLFFAIWSAVFGLNLLVRYLKMRNRLK